MLNLLDNLKKYLFYKSRLLKKQLKKDRKKNVAEK
jgi:hypothetical protein